MQNALITMYFVQWACVLSCTTFLPLLLVGYFSIFLSYSTYCWGQLFIGIFGIVYWRKSNCMGLCQCTMKQSTQNAHIVTECTVYFLISSTLYARQPNLSLEAKMESNWMYRPWDQRCKYWKLVYYPHEWCCAPCLHWNVVRALVPEPRWRVPKT